MRSLFIGLAFKIKLEASAGPAQHFEYRLVAYQRSIGRMFDLTFHEEHFAFIAFIAQRKLAALAAHLERLHQVDHVHLRETSAHHSIGRCSLGHLLERNTVDHALDAARRIFQEERLFQIVVGGILR